MAPRYQNTFTLVPNPLGMQGLVSRSCMTAAAAGARARSSAVDPGPSDARYSDRPIPLMTSKQAQKLYREKNRAAKKEKPTMRRRLEQAGFPKTNPKSFWMVCGIMAALAASLASALTAAGARKPCATINL